MAFRVAKKALQPWKLPHVITVRFVDHDDQRYNTDGDYWSSKSRWIAQLSKMPDWRYSYACMMHELIEMGLTQAHGIDWKVITKFDMDHPEFLDPGHHKDAPYHKEHMEAEKVERMIIKMFDLNWDDYQKAFDVLDAHAPKKASQRVASRHIEAVIKKLRKEDKDDRPAEEQVWGLYTSDGSRLLGRHPTKEKAKAHERAVQYYKHKK